jgi:undecaprenyl phosphate-alpha-L-ara4N flippase subunit ArnE
MITYATAVFTMIIMSFGQVLLKSLAMKIAIFQTVGGNWWKGPSNFLALGASVFTTYVVVLVCWLYVLKALDLNRAFAFVALTFIFVPLLSNLILHERITIGTIIGSLLITTGILVSVNY